MARVQRHSQDLKLRAQPRDAHAVSGGRTSPTHSLTTARFLQQNCIEKIENLEPLSKLVTLNLSHNRIRVVENLGCLPVLRNLDLSSNCLTDYRDLAGLRECTSVASLDISKNYVEPEPGVAEFLLELNWLLCFYFKGNPAIRGIKNYRKVGSGGEAISA